ncbi:MAG: hypothetical protein M3R04_04425 [bacterium]|nr:hypothetical protein [bacterium]
MDYMALLYLALFPMLTVAIGWTMLSRGLLATDDQLALRRVQRWRFVVAFTLFAVAWLALLGAGLLAYGALAPLANRDWFAGTLLIGAVVCLACTGYWLTLIYGAGDVLHLTNINARRAASATLLWNIVATVPYFVLSAPVTTEPLRMIAGL